MTSPGPPVTLPAGQARQALDLLQIAGHVISALRARGQERDLTLAGLEQLALLLASGGGAAQPAAQRDLAAAIPAGREQ